MRRTSHLRQNKIKRHADGGINAVRVFMPDGGGYHKKSVSGRSRSPGEKNLPSNDSSR